MPSPRLNITDLFDFRQDDGSPDRCAVCSRKLRVGATQHLVEMAGDTADVLVAPTDADRVAPDYKGVFAVGPTCWRRIQRRIAGNR